MVVIYRKFILFFIFFPSFLILFLLAFFCLEILENGWRPYFSSYTLIKVVSWGTLSAHDSTRTHAHKNKNNKCMRERNTFISISTTTEFHRPDYLSTVFHAGAYDPIAFFFFGGGGGWTS